MMLVGLKQLMNTIMEVCVVESRSVVLKVILLMLIAKNQIQHAAVQYIITTVVDELLKNKDRKFIYVEIAFFIRWWNEQTDDVKQQVNTNIIATDSALFHINFKHEDFLLPSFNVLKIFKMIIKWLLNISISRSMA